MPAYVIAIMKSQTNADEMAAYVKKAGPSLAGVPVKRLSIYGKHEVLEGEEVEGVVMLEFPTFAEAKAWYDSPAYTDARSHRLKGADFHFMIVDGG